MVAGRSRLWLDCSTGSEAQDEVFTKATPQASLEPEV
jgi:hypothetical protein